MIFREKKRVKTIALLFHWAGTAGSLGWQYGTRGDQIVVNHACSRLAGPSSLAPVPWSRYPVFFFLFKELDACQEQTNGCPRAGTPIPIMVRACGAVGPLSAHRSAAHLATARWERTTGRDGAGASAYLFLRLFVTPRPSE